MWKRNGCLFDKTQGPSAGLIRCSLILASFDPYLAVFGNILREILSSLRYHESPCPCPAQGGYVTPKCPHYRHSFTLPPTIITMLPWLAWCLVLYILAHVSIGYFVREPAARSKMSVVQAALHNNMPPDTKYGTGVVGDTEYVEFSRPPLLFVSNTSRGYYGNGSYSLGSAQQAEHQRTLKAIAATLNELNAKGIVCRVTYEIHGYADAANNPQVVGMYDASLGEVEYMVQYEDGIRPLHLSGGDAISNSQLAALRGISVVHLMTNLGHPVAKSDVTITASEVAVRSASYRKAEMTVKVFVEPAK